MTPPSCLKLGVGGGGLQDFSVIPRPLGFGFLGLGLRGLGPGLDNIKPFSCTMCDKQFTQKSSLTHHINSHQGIKPHLCTICGKQFTKKSNLTVHMRSVCLSDQGLNARRQEGRMSRSEKVPNAVGPSLSDAVESPGELSGVKEHFHDNHTSDLKISGPENLQDCIQQEAVNSSQNNSRNRRFGITTKQFKETKRKRKLPPIQLFERHSIYNPSVRVRNIHMKKKSLPEGLRDQGLTTRQKESEQEVMPEAKRLNVSIVNDTDVEKADEEEKKALHIDDPKPGPSNTNLAILFFLRNYNGLLRNLPGVGEDEKELTEVLKKYEKTIVNSSSDVLNDLKEILEACKQKKFERIHFHFSGREREMVYSHKHST